MDNNNKQVYNYTVILQKEPDGGYHAFCPILKGCHSQGDSFEEAIDNITEAIELYIESLRAVSLWLSFWACEESHCTLTKSSEILHSASLHSGWQF